MKTLVFASLLALLVLPAMAQDLPTVTGPRLDRALSDPAGAMRQDDGTYAVWVHFTDRALTGADLDAALDRAERALPERTLARRAKMAAPGARLVDARDLAPAPAYLQAVEATGASPRKQSRWLNAASFDATRDEIAAIARLPFVAEVELVAGFRRPAPPVTPEEREITDAALEQARAKAADRWTVNYGGSLAGLEQINVPPVHEMGITGEGVIVGMLDSGFKTTHDALTGVPVLARHDFVNDDDVVENETGDPSNQHDHGTKTMSTVMGFADGGLVGPAFGATAILAKTEDVSQEIPVEEDNWVAGLEWAESLGADVVSSSLGYYEWYEFADMDGNTAVTTIAADLAVGRGVCLVNSAGNERGWGFGHIIAPADGDSVIAVGAVSLSGTIASFSSPGPTYDGRIKPDVSAQGVGNHVVSISDDQGYTSADGTSFSCPLTAGVAALVLARAPQLTPIQVREALRMTADRAANPDNDFGWGIVDAHAAVTYWGATIEHAPLTDTEDTVNGYTVTATITDRLPLDPSRMLLAWSTDGVHWNNGLLNQVGADIWQSAILPQSAGTEVSYYLRVTDSADITTMLPAAGAAEPFTFTVGPDTTPPTLVHAPLGDQPQITWPPAVTAEVDDNLGIDRVDLFFSVNGGLEMGPFALENRSGVYVLAFPLNEVKIGDRILYRLAVWDQAAAPNLTVGGPYEFRIIDTLGVVLVIEDGAAVARDVKVDEHKTVLASREGRSSATDLAQWLTDAGYVADVVAADAVTAGSFVGYQAVAYSAGDNTAPLASSTLRAALRDWVLGGGRILVEGGEVGYDALSSPGYDDFAQDVLHAGSWRTDSAGTLQVVAGQETHSFMIRPHALPTSIPVDYDGYGDEDAVDAAGGGVVVMGTSSYPASAGVLVYDDNPAPQAGQVVYFAFNLGAVDPAVGRPLVENALAYLLAGEAPPTATISGRVTIAGTDDASGVTVAYAAGQSVVTGADGLFEFTGLFGGQYTLTASKDGYATEVRTVDVADGAAVAGIDFEMWPVIDVAVSATPGAAIPDNDTGGVVSVITVTQPGALADISVDIAIQHTWIGDLIVRLASPAGTGVTLHDRSGSSADDITGNWPETLDVDGPGQLSDFLGEEILGDWTLTVIDAASGDTGTLQSWGLDLQVPDQVVDAPGDMPSVTRLAGARPNPFNPQTTIAFDLARKGAVRLDVYDLRGQLVRRLVDGELAAGRHDARWDGRDRDGRGAASGVYLCRLSAGGVTQMRKMALVR